ncbi:MAG TPA: hypothetical protein VFV81_05035 [Verrucomicrobiae bacterium]|nr:hypothetical protein [Verrucomicrobiae bacterium]
MNAYLFTAVATRSQVRPAGGRPGAADLLQTWDDCTSLIVVDHDAVTAQKKFQDWLGGQPDGENPLTTEIRRISAAQFIDQWFNENGGAPLDWPLILEQAAKQLESTPTDDFEQGYWVDVDQVVPGGHVSFNIEALRQSLPGEIESGLNWSAEKQFLFVISVLAPMVVRPPADPAEEEGEDSTEADADELAPGELFNSFPQARDKEAAALVLARNSVVAAWLWRRYAAGTPLAMNEIRLDPWSGAMDAT